MKWISTELQVSHSVTLTTSLFDNSTSAPVITFIRRFSHHVNVFFSKANRLFTSNKLIPPFTRIRQTWNGVFQHTHIQIKHYLHSHGLSHVQRFVFIQRVSQFGEKCWEWISGLWFALRRSRINHSYLSSNSVKSSAGELARCTERVSWRSPTRHSYPQVTNSCPLQLRGLVFPLAKRGGSALECPWR